MANPIDSGASTPRNAGIALRVNSYLTSTLAVFTFVYILGLFSIHLSLLVLHET